MNNIRAIEALNQRELEAAIPLSASWHTDWADTAYVYIGGLPYELSEGDIITIFSQFGEPVHVNLIRDKETGKSKGFAFLKYEDQRSTSLAVDNLGGATVLGRIIRVDHTRYKPKEGEIVDENAYLNSGEKTKDEGVRHGKRRRRGDDSGDDDDRTPPREMLKEELELQKLIREHDEEDPMKEYLIRQKKEDVEKARKRLKERRSSRDKHRSHKHKDQPKRSKHYRSPSKDHRRSTRPQEKTDYKLEKNRVREGRTGDKTEADGARVRGSRGNDWEKDSGRRKDDRKGIEQGE